MTDINHKFDFNQAIKKLDKSNTIGSIEQLGDQIQHVWEIAQQVKFDQSYQKINLVVVAGMGGSALGTHVIQSIYKNELKVPVIICNDYKLPNYVNEKTLVIASSYSGNTEETLSALADGIKKGAKITGITSGGQLAIILKEKKYPHLIFEAKYNPSNSPRMALGYSIFGQMSLFSQLELLNITHKNYEQVLETIAKLQTELSRHVKTDNNPAKLLAFSFVDRLPIITVAQHLEGAAHVFANQINENSKQYSEFRVIPEINHHLMEGLKFPQNNEHRLIYATFSSNLYLKSNQQRMILTQQVIEKNNLSYLDHQLTSPSKLTQAFELILLGSYTNYYLAMLNGQDPTPIPWVDWFKKQLKK